MARAEILVVDDSATQLEALRALLETAGFAVHTARSGEAALERAQQGGIDLVLSDVVMPGLSGYELCAAIKRQLGAESAPPVVLLTSLSDPVDIVRGLECGADNYITKPYDPEHLVARILQVLENRQLRDERTPGATVSIRFMGETFTVGAEREQILDLLLSSFEELIRTNDALQESKRALADAHARELEHEQEARAQAENSARRMELLARASAALSSSLDEQTAIDTVAELVIPVLADACVIDTIAEDGAHAAAIAHREESGRVLLQRVIASSGGLAPWAELTRGDEPTLIDPLPAPFFEECPVDDEARAALRNAGLRAALLVAMSARGRRLGTLVLLRTGEYGFSPADVTHANELANRVALAIDNVRLFRQAERDRAAAEQAAESIAALYDSERHARAEAEAATRVRDEVLAIVSHDLRNPLGIIFTGTSLLLELPLSEEQRTHQLQVLKRAAQRMERLIADLLEVSHLESGRLTLHRNDNRVRELLIEAQDSFQPLAEEKGIVLTTNVVDDAGTVHVDRERILQVFANLVGNAVKFTPEGGRITISAEPADALVSFCVEDTGAGIAADDLPRIFDRFWQARKTAHAGTGLGLAIAKGIVEGHGGQIWATSEEGAGSRFCFTVPRTS